MTSLLLAAALAATQLDSIFTDGFVFPAKHPTVLTGQSEPGREIKVLVDKSVYKTTAGADGRFAVTLPAFGVRKDPFEVRVTDRDGACGMKNCLSGLVLLAAGQSNMEIHVDETLDPEKEIASSDHPFIREFRIEHDFNFVPQRQCRGKWTTVSPKTAAKVGAIGLYTARILQKELGGIPVGIVNNSYGGSPIQAWLPLEIIRKDFPRSIGSYDRFCELGRDGAIARCKELGKTFLVSDSGNKGEAQGWHRGAATDWQDVKIPCYLDYEVYGEGSDGAFWIARTFTVPDDFLDRETEFRVTAIDDHDVTYVNGVKIGATGEETPDPWDQPRAYRVPKGLLKKGVNTIAIRIFDTAHAGGIPPGSKIVLACGEKELSLAGVWKTKAELVLKSKAWHPDYLSLVKIYHAGSVLYNAMFRPVAGIPYDAVLWYQGESNAGQRNYGEMFDALINRWRDELGEPEVPFVFMQLAAFRSRPKSAADVGDWPLTRQHQAEARKLKNVRMVPTIDIGDENRIHPLNKQEIGRRTALVLLQDFFAPDRFKGVVAYPEATGVVREGDELVVTLKDAAGLKTTDGRLPQSFAVVGETDPKTRKAPAAWAAAKIVGGAIRVTIPAELPEPKRLRYAWCMNPDVNTVNGLGFPLLPFDFGL